MFLALERPILNMWCDSGNDLVSIDVASIDGLRVWYWFFCNLTFLICDAGVLLRWWWWTFSLVCWCGDGFSMSLIWHNNDKYITSNYPDSCGWTWFYVSFMESVGVELLVGFWYHICDVAVSRMLFYLKMVFKMLKPGSTKYATQKS